MIYHIVYIPVIYRLNMDGQKTNPRTTNRTIRLRTHIGDITIAWDMEDFPTALIVTEDGIVKIDLTQLVYNEYKKMIKVA